MIVFNVDLDNTLIYSYKHDIGPEKRNVELYQGREISFITDRTYALIKQIRANKNILMVPTTTRTVEQYNRINLETGEFKYALCCNGGLLLEDGISNEEWYKKSLELISDSKEELLRAINILDEDKRRTFELRFIENLFVFTKCDEPENVVEDLKSVLDQKYVDVFNNGVKVYVVPKKLSKGQAVKRFKEYINADSIMAAGDSEFDISMLEEADYPVAPYGFSKAYNIDFNVNETDEGKLFSERMLEMMCIESEQPGQA